MKILDLLEGMGNRDRLDGRHLDGFKTYVLNQLMKKDVSILDNPKYEKDVYELADFGMIDMARGRITTKGAMALKQRKEMRGESLGK